VNEKIPYNVSKLSKDIISNKVKATDPKFIYADIFSKLIGDAKIIITTCSVAGDKRLFNVDFPICIIDDASAILEPMTMIPLAHGV
jgi:superfamily I DNA and/or RNA helicase